MSFQPRSSQPAETAAVTVERVEEKTISKKDGTNAKLYEVYVAGSVAPLSTFKRSLAEQAFELIGESSEVSFTTRQNGEFTNYYLDSILPAAPSPIERARRAQEATPFLRTATGLPEPAEALTEARASVSEKDRSICRQTAGKVAATLFAAAPSDAPTFWENVERLSVYFETGVVPGKPTAGYEEEDIPF